MWVPGIELRLSGLVASNLYLLNHFTCPEFIYLGETESHEAWVGFQLLILLSPSLWCMCVLWGVGDGTQGFMHARQVLYQLSYSSKLGFSSFFSCGSGSFKGKFLLNGLKLQLVILTHPPTEYWNSRLILCLAQ